MSTLISKNHEIETLAQDLARDIKEMKYEGIIIYTNGNANSMSKAEFEILREELTSLAPDISVVYRATNSTSLLPGCAV